MGDKEKRNEYKLGEIKSELLSIQALSSHSEYDRRRRKLLFTNGFKTIPFRSPGWDSFKAQ